MLLTQQESLIVLQNGYELRSNGANLAVCCNPMNNKERTLIQKCTRSLFQTNTYQGLEVKQVVVHAEYKNQIYQILIFCH